MQKLIQILTIFVLLRFVTGCSLSIYSFADNLSQAILSNDDPQTVMQALPAYLILLDGLIENDPADEDVLMTSAKLMGAYAGLLGVSIELADSMPVYQQKIMQAQQKKLHQKALQRATLAICLYEENFCGLRSLGYAEFESRLKLITEDDIDMLYSLGTAWLNWVQVNSGNWNAMAQLPQIKLIMQVVVNIDENWQHAGAHMYLGVLNSLLPKSLGGKPETGKFHFETAIRLTHSKNLMVKVLFAQYYARLVFNKVLHQQLIADVLSSKDTVPSLILFNTLAKQKAKALQKSATNYF